MKKFVFKNINVKHLVSNADRYRLVIEARGSGGCIDLVLSRHAEHLHLQQEEQLLRQRRNEHAAAARGGGASRADGAALRAALRGATERLHAAERALLEAAAAVPNDLPDSWLEDRAQWAEPRVLRSHFPAGFPGHAADHAADKDQNQDQNQDPDQDPIADPARDHLRLDRRHGWALFDFDAAARVCGGGHVTLRHEAALLDGALAAWALARLAARGWAAWRPADLARLPVLEGCGFAPRGDDAQFFRLGAPYGALALVGTAEAAVMGAFAGVKGVPLPTRVAAAGHCFRTERGAGARDRGLYRLRQFTKVEMAALCRPEDAESLLEEMVAEEEAMLRELGLAYRVLEMPPRDLGAPALRKVDVEAWMPGRGFGEVTSASICGEYQCQRLNVRDHEHRHPWSLNATALAVPRVLLALIETHADEAKGVVRLPECLVPFMGGVTEIRPKPKEPGGVPPFVMPGSWHAPELEELAFED